MSRNRRYEIGVGCLLLAAVGVFGFLAFQIGALDRFGKQIHLSVDFENAAGLQAGAVVTIAGVEIGTVEQISLIGGKAHVDLAVQSNAGVDPQALARIRMRSMLGEKYVEILPSQQSQAIVVDGTVLGVAEEQVEIDALLSKMGPLLTAIDPDKFNKLMQSFDKDPEQISRMLTNLDRLLENTATSSEQLPDILAEGRGTLSVAHSTFQQANQRIKEIEPLVVRADQILEDTEQATNQLPILVAEVQSAVGQTSAILTTVDEKKDKISLILDNLSEIDRWELRRLLREEGVLIRLKAREVDPNDHGPWDKKGHIKE